MHNLKFCNKLLSLLLLSIRHNKLWFDIIFTKNNQSLLYILQSHGIISSFFKYYKGNLKLVRVFPKYISLRSSLIFPYHLYFKPGHKVSVKVNQLQKINRATGNLNLIVSTSIGLKTLSECLEKNIGGFLFLVIY